MPRSVVQPWGVLYRVPTPGPIHSKSFMKMESIIILVKQMNPPNHIALEPGVFEHVIKIESHFTFLVFFNEKALKKCHIGSDFPGDFLVLNINELISIPSSCNMTLRDMG